MVVLNAWSSMRGLLNVAAPAALLLAVGCHGEVNGGAAVRGVGGADGQAGSAGSTGATGGSSASSLTIPTMLATPSACTSNAPGPRKLWRLTGSELTASIHSIFADTANAAPVSTIFNDPSVLGFSIDSNALLVQGLNASQLQDNAEAISAWAATDNKLSAFASCAASTSGAPDATCASQFIQAFGRLAFRTSLTANDPRIATYTSLFMSGTSNSDGAQVVISAMLQSPYFLYRSELGTASGANFALTPYEVATELAYTLTGTTPDSTLLAAADSASTGGMTVAAMVEQQANRLIAANSSTASTAVMGFMDGWLGLSRLYTTAKDTTVFMGLTPAIQQDMWTESQSLIMEAFNNSGSFGSVLTADHSFLNQELASFYGISAGSGSAFTSVKYAGATTRDPGLLGTGTILNGYARPGTDSPTQRGHMIRSRMLCQAISMPPAGLNTTFTPATMVETTRQHFVNEHENGVCATCHKQMDWIGFAFENYDGFGRYRTTETDQNLPIDSSGTVYNDPQGNNVNVTGLSGTGSLSTYLAQSDDVTKCMERYWTYYTFGSSTWAQDACTYNAVYDESKANGFTLKSTLMAIIHAASFTTRVQDQ